MVQSGVKTCVLYQGTGNETTLRSLRSFLVNYPNNQHIPVVIEKGYQVQTIKSILKPRKNFRKIDWSSFTKIR